MTRDTLAKLFLAVNVLAAAGVFVAAATLTRPEQESKYTAGFRAAATQGEAAYRARCTGCHGAPDPRFLEYPGWARTLRGTGCVRTTVDLTPDERESILNFLRGASAGSEDEAGKIAEVERRKMEKEFARRGAGFYESRCATCHDHRLFPRTRTAAGWAEHLGADTVAYHTAKGETVELPGAESHPLSVYLRLNAAGGAQDASIFRALVASGGSFEAGEADALVEVDWITDYDAGMAEARGKKKPVLLNLTIEGGT
jgi:cytochrome c5